jgi:ADP-ribosylation factor related protein 1
MFSLFAGCYEYATRKEEIHILIIGLDRSGKTLTLERLKALYTDTPSIEADKLLPTVGLNIARFNHRKSPLVFWDLGGQAGLRSIWDKYYAETHAIIFVIDASEQHRFDEAKIVLNKVMRHRDLTGAPLLVLANKQDAPGAMAAIEIRERLGLGRDDVNSLNGNGSGGGRAVDVQPSSALDGDGLATSVDWVLEKIKKSHRADVLRKRVG